MTSCETARETANSLVAASRRLAMFTTSPSAVMRALAPLVPLPSARLGDKFGKAAAGVDAEKLKAFGQKYNPTLSAIPKTASAACLPSVAALDELSLAQAELGRSFGAAESKAFGAYALGTVMDTSLMRRSNHVRLESVKSPCNGMLAKRLR